MTGSVTSFFWNASCQAPRRFFTRSDHQELMEARKSGKGSVIWWPCAQDLLWNHIAACRKQALESHQVGLEVETSSDVGTHVTDASELTSSQYTEVSELPSSASAAAFAGTPAAGKTVDNGVLSEMQRLCQENLRLVTEMEKLRKPRAEFSEASTNCIDICSDQMSTCTTTGHNPSSNSSPMRNTVSTTGGKMR